MSTNRTLSFAAPADHPSPVVIAWNWALSAVSLGNVIAWVVIALTCRRRAFAHQKAQGPTPSWPSWDHVWNARLLLALIYVVACAVRGILPRHDGERACMWDHPLSPTLVGRSLAFVAELSFAALCCATIVQIIGNNFTRRIATVALSANFVAQNCCNYAVLTGDQFGHVIEESIWTGTAIVMCLICGLAMARPDAFAVSASRQARSFLWAAVLGGPVYITFMVLVDVPMYYYRALDDLRSGRTFLTLWQGLSEISTCRLVTQSEEVWAPEMPWMSLYFSVAVWASLWMASADIQSDKTVGRTEKAARYVS